MVAGWTLVGRILALGVLTMYSVSIGLIDNGILRSEMCCGEDDMCWEVLYLENEAFYDGATGLRTRYILFVLCLFLCCLLRWLESSAIRPVFVFVLYEIGLVVAVLTGDSSIRSFGNTPLNIGEAYGEFANNDRFNHVNCAVEPATVELNMVCSWLGLIGSCVLFFIACLELPFGANANWPQGTLNLGYIHDMHRLGVKDDDEEDVV